MIWPSGSSSTASSFGSSAKSVVIQASFSALKAPASSGRKSTISMRSKLSICAAMANPIYEALPTTIFAVMSGLAQETGAINLGQGFPDEPGPEAIRRRAAEESLDRLQPVSADARPAGAARGGGARTTRAARASTSTGRREVTVTSGATEALAASFLALISPGDEVVVFQPLYDSYLPMIRRAGGVPKLVRLAPPRLRGSTARCWRRRSPSARGSWC